MHIGGILEFNWYWHPRANRKTSRRDKNWRKLINSLFRSFLLLWYDEKLPAAERMPVEFLLIPSPEEVSFLRNKLFPLILMLLGGALIIGAVAFIFVNSDQNSAPELVQPPEGDNYPDILRVSVQEAREALEDGSAIFLDVRSAESFEAGHIPGAISMPIGEISERINELPSNAWIITYCA